MIELNKIYNECCLETMKRIPDGLVDLVFTSPPYNMRTRVRDGKYTEREIGEGFSRKYRHFDDALTMQEYYEFHEKVIAECLRISKITLWNIQIVTGSKESVFKLIGKFSQQIKDIIIWDKGNGQPAMNGSVLNKATELILIFEDSGPGRAIKNSFFDRGAMNDIWRIPRAKSKDGHGATFPEMLVKTALEAFSKRGGVIYDPFLGSGTTALCAAALDRNYIGSEITEEYFKMAEGRIEPYIKNLFTE